MRRLLIGLSLASFLVSRAHPASAQESVQAVIDKAIQAHGGEEKLNSLKAFRSKSKGTLEVMGLRIAFTQEAAAMLSGKLKDVMEVDAGGMKSALTTVFDGTRGWLAGIVNKDMDDKMIAETKSSLYLMDLERLTPLRDNGFRLAALGEKMVNDRPAIGVGVSKDGQKDAKLYFDKANGLLVKVESQATDLQSGQEFTQEKIILEYQDFDGYKTGKKVLVLRDGKKLMEAEVVEAKFMEKIDDSEFQKP
jgi:hypothetical protein